MEMQPKLQVRESKGIQETDSTLWSLCSNGLFLVSSFFSTFSSPPPSLSTILPFSTPWFPLKFQGFLWKIAWRKALTRVFFQRFHPNLVLYPQVCFLRFANSESTTISLFIALSLGYFGGNS